MPSGMRAMNESMIERVAREVHRLHPDSLVSVVAWKNLTLDERDECIEIARAAIKAMREPTEKMQIDAGDLGDGLGLTAEVVCLLWQAMIDEILKDG